MELIDRLKQLSKRILDELKGTDFKLEPYEVFIPDFTEMHFKNGKVEYFLETQKIWKRDIDFEFAVPKFYQDNRKKLSDFNEVLMLLENEFQFNTEEAENVIKNFVYYLIYKIKDEFDEEKLDKLVNGFIQKLKIGTPYIKTKIYLDGIWTSLEPIEINENLKIRRIKPSDFLTHSQHILEQEFQPFGDFPTSIVRYNIPIDSNIKSLTKLQRTILKKIRMVIYSFLLFKFGSIFSRKCITPNFKPSAQGVLAQVITGFGYTSCLSDFTKGIVTHLNPHIHIKTRHTYLFSGSDASKIDNFIVFFVQPHIIKNLLRKSIEPNYINIALQRYQNAFLNVENLESQISYAISCLEALYSTKGKDLTRKLCQRISILFKVLGFSPLIIFKIVRDAYKVRSYYSHGEVVKIRDITSHHENIRILARQILECARISLLIFIQIDHLLGRKDMLIALTRHLDLKRKSDSTVQRERKRYFIKVLDDSLIDSRIYLRLNNFILRNSKLSFF
jgi:hypothetical protein